MFTRARSLASAVLWLIAVTAQAQTSGSNPADRDLAPGPGIVKGQIRHERPVVWSTQKPRTAEPVYPTTGDAAKRYGGLNGGDFKGPNDPRLVEVHRVQIAISDRFGTEINRTIADAGLGAQVETSTKTPGSIYGKLARKTGEGKEYPLGRMTDLSRGRINVESNDMREVAAIDKVLRERFGLPPNSDDSPNFMQDFLSAKDPQSGYARSHLIVRDEKGNAFELQIGTRDMSRFIDAPVGGTNIHDAIYKGKDLGINTPPQLTKEYNQLLVDISRANAQGRSAADDPALAQRIKKFQTAVHDSLPEGLKKAPKPPEDPWKIPPAVTILSTQGGGAVGIDKGPFKDGRWNWAEGENGRIGMDVLRAEGTYRGALGVTKEGVRADVVVEGQAILAGVSGELRGGIGDPNGMNSATGNASGKAFVGADGQLVGTAAINKTGVKAVGNINAFVGAKARGQIGGTGTLCGLAVTGTGTGEVSAGAGGGASGAFAVDFATWTVKLGGQADLAVGVGGGLGGTVEISAEKIVRNPGAAKDCVVGGIKAAGAAASDAASAVGGWFQSGWKRLTGGPAKPPVALTNTIVSMNGGYGANTLNGSGVGRYSSTLPQGLQGEPSNQKAGRAIGAGMRR